MTIFSTPKRTEKSWHVAVGEHTVERWEEYSVMTVEWRNGRVTKHLNCNRMINGVIDSSCSYGVGDTERIAKELGLTL